MTSLHHSAIFSFSLDAGKNALTQRTLRKEMGAEKVSPLERESKNHICRRRKDAGLQDLHLKTEYIRKKGARGR
jgi:hypothetical protein